MIRNDCSKDCAQYKQIILFSSSQHFANTFKNATGMTPTDYRIHCAGLTAAELRKWTNVDFRSEQEERLRVKPFITA